MPTGRYATKLTDLETAALATPGSTDSSLRAAVAGRVTALSGESGVGTQAVPLELQRYVDLLAGCAHEIADSDVERLRAAGYSEDEIFEVTVAGAVAAGMARVKRGLTALNGSGT